MSDVALRALEREARARPHDLAAGWAYAVGLERTGERRALWLELCRLARAGEPRAVAAVDGWLPGLGGTSPGVVGLRAPKVARVALIEDEAFERDVVGLARSSPGGAALVLVGDELLAVDPAREEVRWRQQGVAALEAYGDDALVVARDRSALVRSAEVEDVSVGAGLVGPGTVIVASGWADRLLVRQAKGRLGAFEVGAPFGRVLWQVDEHASPRVVGRQVLLCDDRLEVLSCRDLSDGHVRWRRALGDADDLHRWWDADMDGAVVHEWSAGRGARTTSLDLANGREVWSVSSSRAARCQALRSDVVVVEEDDRLVAWSRADGRLSWSAPLQVGEPYAAAERDGLLHVAYVHDGVLHLLTIETRSGAPIGNARVRLPAAAADGSADLAVIHAQGIDVLVGTPSPLLVLVRFAG